MNQILFIQNNSNNSYNNFKSKHILYKFIFSFCIIGICFFIFFGVKNYYNSNSSLNSSNNLSEAIKIQYLYNNNLIDNSSYPIIGKIEIPSLNILYPIFSETNDELLKLGICKVYGPSINNKRKFMFSWS